MAAEKSPRRTDAKGRGALDARIAADCEPLRLDNQLCFALYRASRLMIQAYQPLLGPLDLTYPQYIALLVLWERDDMTVSGLGGRLGLDSGTLSPLLKKLEAKGLLARERSESDERSVRLRLTPAGRELKRKAAKIPEAMACIPGLQDRDVGKLKRDLEALSRVLGAAAD
jgi:DNA-binding MarR family transcriptional regulator